MGRLENWLAEHAIALCIVGSLAVWGLVVVALEALTR